MEKCSKVLASYQKFYLWPLYLKVNLAGYKTQPNEPLFISFLECLKYGILLYFGKKHCYQRVWGQPHFLSLVSDSVFLLGCQFFTFFLWLHSTVYGILVPQPKIEPGPLAVKVWSPKHWTVKEFPNNPFLFSVTVFFFFLKWTKYFWRKELRVF